jgi:phosphonoacetate hydrolase
MVGDPEYSSVIGAMHVTTVDLRSNPAATTVVEVNGRSYAAPQRPTVVIVVDGFDPAYLEHGFANGTLPAMKSFKERGFVGIADCSMPSTTNTNNTSIVTGVPPSVMASMATTISMPRPAKKS